MHHSIPKFWAHSPREWGFHLLLCCRLQHSLDLMVWASKQPSLGALSTGCKSAWRCVQFENCPSSSPVSQKSHQSLGCCLYGWFKIRWVRDGPVLSGLWGCSAWSGAGCRYSKTEYVVLFVVFLTENWERERESCVTIIIYWWAEHLMLVICGREVNKHSYHRWPYQTNHRAEWLARIQSEAGQSLTGV